MSKCKQEPIIGQELADFLEDVWSEREFNDNLECWIDYQGGIF
jgi:hypothetical protein